MHCSLIYKNERLFLQLYKNILIIMRVYSINTITVNGAKHTRFVDFRTYKKYVKNLEATNRLLVGNQSKLLNIIDKQAIMMVDGSIL
jgi:uncharacterized protein (UPF0305 family)